MDNDELRDKIIQNIERIISKSFVSESGPFDISIIPQTSRYICDGSGQMLRPRLVLGASRPYKVQQKTSLWYGAILEIVHAGTLALDDLPCMDNADLRRGKPSCHRTFGETRTILSCYSLDSDLREAIYLTSLKIEKQRVIEKEINIAQKTLSIGQEADISQTRMARTLDDFALIYDWKTGTLMGAAAAIGAILGDAEKSDVNHLRNFGRNIGISYQFFDDWKDRYCNEEEVRKSVGLDVRKNTPFNIAEPELVLVESLKHRGMALKELSKIKGKRFKELVTLSIHMFSLKKAQPSR